jgi:hypothetical protein
MTLNLQSFTVIAIPNGRSEVFIGTLHLRADLGFALTVAVRNGCNVGKHG